MTAVVIKKNFSISRGLHNQFEVTAVAGTSSLVVLFQCIENNISYQDYY